MDLNTSLLKITPENHAHLSRTNDHRDPAFKECLEAHESLNDVLTKAVGDCGGGYLSWLNDQNIPSGDGTGWWSIEAFDPVNVQRFIVWKSNLTRQGAQHEMDSIYSSWALQRG